MPRILAIDYGTKRVGIATTDNLQLIASPLTTIEAHKTTEYLKKYLQTETVETIVVGKPLRLDGSETHGTQPAEKFVHLLRKEFPHIQVVQVDERFTSAIAKRSMLDMGMKKKDRQKKENLDSMSAALILQTYLEMKSNII
jgi:putative Holliday junction resolvase